MRAEPRFTRDADLAVATTDDAQAEAIVAQAEAIVAQLGQLGYDPLMSVEQEARSRLATVRLKPPAGSASGVVLDLLFASSGIEPEIVAAAEAVSVTEGLSLPVARAGHRIALKLLAEDEAHRAQDRADLVALLAGADDGELELAREAVELIAARGYDRGRDLAGALDEWLAGR